MLRPTRVPMIVLALLALALMAAGCAMPMPAASPTTGSEMAAEAAPVPVAGELTVDSPRARPAPLEGGNGAAFLTVLNGTDSAVRLTSAESDVSSSVELHETVNDGGVMKMIPRPEGFEIPAGGSIVLAPGGKHVMFIGLTKPLAEGDSFALKLIFDNGASLDVTVPVVAMTGMSGAPAAGAMGATGAMTQTGEVGDMAKPTTAP